MLRLREKNKIKEIKNSVIKRSFLFSSLSFSIFGGEIHAWKQRFKNRKKKKERIALSSTCTQSTKDTTLLLIQWYMICPSNLPL
jgi:hypothetical protein